MEHIGSAEAGTLFGLFQTRVERSPEGLAYRQYSPERGDWIDYSWREVAHLTERWRTALAGESLDPGERVAILLDNGLDWVAFDVAALSLGLVTVPFYPSDTPDNFAFFLKDTGARLLLAQTADQWRAIRALAPDLPDLKRVVVAEPIGPVSVDDPLVQALLDWLPATAGNDQAVDTVPDALATIIYTSGTTGRPKGVMLSHRNILSAIEAVLQAVKGVSDDVFISYLPLAHSFERTVGYYLPMMLGASIGYARSTQTLAKDLLIIRPTIFMGVPRVFERAFAAIKEKAGRSAVTARLLDWTERLGWRRFEAVHARAAAPGLVARAAWFVLERLVAARILARFGGRVRIAVTGGARMSEQVERFFISLGLPLLEGYGLAEAASPICANLLEDNLVGSVGRPLNHAEVKTDSSGELLVRSPGVMLGYWNQPDATRATIDPDGWLRTGDIAELIDGRVHIRGRRKEILVTSTGENVPPGNLEAAMIVDPLVKQVMVVGDGRPYLSALVVLEPDEWRRFAGPNGVDPADRQILDSQEVREMVLERLKPLLAPFPRYAQVRALHLTLEEWTVESGLATTTMKLKRSMIEKKYAAAIDALYEGHAMPAPSASSTA
ncbi:MAG: long-chain fatty acid--CoA ligase [Alphaproteobacteria bacterium]|nr:long-chain fatty acid--CoA ligase [Alphaproteobacteria bacterium]